MSNSLSLSFILLYMRLCPSSSFTFEDPNPRIVGGSATTINNVPYLVNLRRNEVFICGGTLISAQFVVTAAHCVKGSTATSITVTGGVTYLTESGVRRSVAKIISPKSYRQSNMNMDVAVLKLSSAMTGSNIGTIGLCDSNGNVDEMIQVSGWGLTSENAPNVPNRVRTVQLPLMAKAKCAQQYKGKATLTNSMFCASTTGTKDSCEGDSGGPAVYKGQLCGIVSWGIGCARSSYPGVYTSITAVRSFIEQALKM